MSRKKTDEGAVADLTRRLRGLFRTLEARAVPDRLRSVVDQLDEGEDEADDQAPDRSRGRR